MICVIPNPRPDIFLVAKIERLLSDCQYDIYMRAVPTVDAKTALKATKSVTAASQRLFKYRTMFAWTFR